MKTLKFECILLSDIIINQKAATEGVNTTLDFIPGNTFLGIVASRYTDFGNKAIEVFHSGKVRFGDAHPMSRDLCKKRSLRVPSSMFYPKQKGIAGGCYISHFYHRENDHKNEGLPQQLKQCRQGFYSFSQDKGYPAPTEKTFAIKSAYDTTNRRSKDNMMYGYESLEAGAHFLFEIEIEDDNLAYMIRDILVGVHYIGRSRTAQYGQVEIREFDYEDTPSTQGLFFLDNDKQYATVYADGRLIFLDAECEPTFIPTAADLGILDGEIDLELSQIRTFCYAPWNSKRSTRDAERCGIEKGSVFLVKINKPQEYSSRYVGMYRNEGFGKVIYNPEFLTSCGNNGEARTHLLGEISNTPENRKEEITQGDTKLLRYIKRKQKETQEDEFIYHAVNTFVEMYNDSLFKGNISASQWGTIRSIAMKELTYEKIDEALFTRKKEVTHTKDNIVSYEDDAYLTHGVSAKKWEEKGRRDKLQKFINDVHSTYNIKKFGDITAKALINLASEMGKKTKQTEND